MLERSSPLLPGGKIALAVLVGMLVATNGWSQSPPPASLVEPAQPPASPQVQPAPPGVAPTAPAPAENPGLFDEMGKALEKSLSILPTLKSPSETLDGLKDAAKNASEGLSRLAGPSSMAEGRVKCPVAPNGVSDCKAAADRLCQSKGLKQGKSLSTDSVEACSPKVLIPGRTRKPDDCRTENFVTRALCQ